MGSASSNLLCGGEEAVLSCAELFEAMAAAAVVYFRNSEFSPAVNWEEVEE